jgi:hypothetical protein
MKNFLKLFGIIAMVAVIGFSMAACGGDDDGDDGDDTITSPKTVSGELIAGGTTREDAQVKFYLTARDFDDKPLKCDVTITTNLPAPYDSFKLVYPNFEIENEKELYCSEQGQKVTFTATTSDKGGLFLEYWQNFQGKNGTVWIHI